MKISYQDLKMLLEFNDFRIQILESLEMKDNDRYRKELALLMRVRTQILEDLDSWAV